MRKMLYCTPGGYKGRVTVRTAFLALVLIVVVRMPAWSQEATVVGLKGPVHTVLTEYFRTEGSALSEPIGSALEIYDQQGYQLEVYRYKPDGSLWGHTVIDRNGPQIQRMQITCTTPFEAKTTQNVFDADGHVVETDTYDANGVLISKSTFEVVQKRANSSTYHRTERSADGTENTVEVTESTDPQTGIEHQVQTRNGKPETDWVIQQNEDGTEKDKLVFADGSYNERERQSDGTTVEDRYYARTKSHTFQKSDPQGHPIEVIQQYDSYYIRCTYSFDKDGRSTGQINYDAAGNIVDKSTDEYRDDSHGNWVERKSITWDTKTQTMRPKIVETTLRTINYY